MEVNDSNVVPKERIPLYIARLREKHGFKATTPQEYEAKYRARLTAAINQEEH